MNAELIEKSQKFGEKVIRFCKDIKIDAITQTLITEIVQSSTAIGASIVKVDGNMDSRTVMSRLKSCKAYCLETKHWLRMIAEADSDTKEQGRELWKDAQELENFFTKMIMNSNLKNN